MAEIDKFIIMEDDIPRDGGRYPEYTYTFLIGLQSFAGGIARGYEMCIRDRLRGAVLSPGMGP